MRLLAFPVTLKQVTVSRGLWINCSPDHLLGMVPSGRQDAQGTKALAHGSLVVVRA
jgi:hypothetical protein